MPSRPPLLCLLLLLLACGCRQPFHGPLRLLETRTADGAAPAAAALTTAGDTRAALLRSARFDVPLPERALLTYGVGLTWAGAGEAPGWFRLSVRAGGRLLDERRLNPRAARGWRDVSLELDGLGRRATLEFELRFTDRDGRDIPQPNELLLGVSEPTLHDLRDYGRAKGVLLVSIDTLRRDHVGAYGYARPTTPTLDALARRGLLVDDAVSVSSWTLPAHASLLTSVEPGVHGATHMQRAFNRRVPTLPGVLRARGFATQAVTSHLYVSSVYGLDDGFDHLDFHQDRKARDTAERAIALLDRLGDRPFFLFLHFYDPHWHYDPPEYARKLFDSGYAGKLTGLWQDFKTRGRDDLSAGDLQHILDLYDGEIRATDDELGRILAHLERRGLAANTLVAVTSDHGEEFLDHGSWEHQKTLYEEVVRVPLVLAGPGVAPARERSQAGLLDVAPTVLAWAGVPVPPSMTGRDLRRPLDARDAYGETEHTLDRRPKVFLRGGAGRWKAVFSLSPDGAKVLGSEWYDLATDAGETRSAPPRDEVAATLRNRALRRFADARRQGGPASRVTLSPEQAERLRALGYILP